jgi:hypothetical protein
MAWLLFHRYVEGDILKMELKKYGEFEAILMDPPWHTGAKDDPARLPGTVTPEELVPGGLSLSFLRSVRHRGNRLTTRFVHGA